MLFLNNEILTPERIISYFQNQILVSEHASSTQKTSPLSQLKNKLKTNFFEKWVGCDLQLTTIPPGDVDVAELARTPTLIKQGERYFIHGSPDGKIWRLTELNNDLIAQAQLVFPMKENTTVSLPYHTQYQTVYNHILSQKGHANLNKRPTNEHILEMLDADARLNALPQFREVLRILFALTDNDDHQAAFDKLKIFTNDWQALDASEQFIVLNQKHGAFDANAEQNHILNALFKELSISCQSMMRLFEDNNVLEENGLAYKYAYMLMALFVDPTDCKDAHVLFNTIAQDAHKLLTQSDWVKDRPFHDILLVRLRLPSAIDMNDRAGWIKLIKKEGENVFPALSIAKKIETKIDEETTNIAKKCPDCGFLFMPTEPDKGLSDIELANFNSAYILVRNPKKSLFKLYYVNKQTCQRTEIIIPPKKLDLFLQKAAELPPNIDNIESVIDRYRPAAGLRAPVTLKEAMSIHAQCQFDRTQDDEEFSAICHRYKRVNEPTFNACLNYMDSSSPRWPKKTGDTIPEIIIRGEGDAEGYVWLKLPHGDKRALILGDITDCCQSISGHSERCVKDAVSRQNNGLYVLLKRRSKEAHPLLVDNQINDTHFDIIGQSYVWKSATNNICLDSIECLNNSIPDMALKKILTDFANQLLHAHPDVHVVTVGCGGKTPNDLFSPTTIPEKMREGFAYPDSETQYSIAKLSTSMTNEQRLALSTLLAPYKSSFQNSIDYFSYYLRDATHFVEELEVLLKKYPELVDEFTPGAMTRLLYVDSSVTINDLYPVDFDALDHLSPLENEIALKSMSVAQMTWRETTPQGVLRALQYVSQDKHLFILKRPFEGGGTVLNNAAYDGDSKAIKAILNIYPEDERFEAVMKPAGDWRWTILHAAAQKYPQHEQIACLTAILDALPINQRFEAVIARNIFGESIFFTFLTACHDNLESLKAVLDQLPENQRLSALQQKNDKGITALSRVVSKPTFLMTIITSLPEEEQFTIVQKYSVFFTSPQLLLEMKNIWHNKLTRMSETISSQDFSGIKQQVTHATTLAELKKAINTVNMSMEKPSLDVLLNRAIDDPASIRELLSNVSDNQLMEALKKTNEDGETLLHLSMENPDSLTALLKALPVHERLHVLRETDNKGISVLHRSAEFPEALIAILSALPSEQRIEVFKERNEYEQTVLHILYPVSSEEILQLKAMLGTLPNEQDRLEVLKEKDILGSDILHAHQSISECIAAVLSYYPENKRLQALTEENPVAIAAAILKSPFFLVKILPILNDTDRFKVAQEYSAFFTGGISVLNNELFFELKSILLKKIMQEEVPESQNTNQSVMSNIRQKINQASTLSELQEQLNILSNVIKCKEMKASYLDQKKEDGREHDNDQLTFTV